MRKIALLTLLGSLAVALSSCIIIELPVSGFRFESNWRESTGAYAFCTDPAKDTYMRYSFRAPDPALIAKVTEFYEGEATGIVLKIVRPLTDLQYANGRFTFTGKLTFGQGLVPQNLGQTISPLSVVVSPIFPPPPPNPPASDNGGTLVRVEVQTKSSSYSGSYFFNTYANCP